MKLEINFFCYCLLIILFNTQTICAQETHYSENFTISEYKAGNQNWDIKKAENGKLFVANNNGLLEFDGLNWNLWEMPNKTVVRSVLINKDRIYVGSFEEFGYWKRNIKGLLEYTSLIKSVGVNKPRDNEEFWQICLFGESIMFRSFSGIYQYKNDQLSHFELGHTMMACNTIDNEFYVSTLDHGIFKLEEEELKPFIYNDLLKDVRVISITKDNSNQLFIATALKGCFLKDKDKLVTWNSEINEIIKKQHLNRFSRLHNGNMIFGTIKNGIYVTNSFGKVLYNINKELGLLNNTILGQNISKDNELWLGLDNGITSIDLSSPYYLYNDITGNIGAVYDVINYRGTIYIGSNTGLHYLNAEKKLQFVDGSQGQVWDLKEINGDLFCGHNNGTFLVRNNKLEQISSHTGGFVIKKVPERKDVYVQGTYTGLVVYNKQSGIWNVNHLGNHIKPIKFLVFEDQYTAWAAHAYKGLYRVKFDKNYKNIVSFEDYSGKGLLSSYNVRLYKFNNTITFHTQKGWQKYEPLLDSIVPNIILNEKIGVDSYIISEDNSTSNVFKSGNLISVNSELSNIEKSYIPRKYYKGRLISGNENISKIGDSILALNLFNGFLIINPFKLSKKDSLTNPLIERISINNELIDLNSNSIELPFKNNNISVRVSSPGSGNYSFEYDLSNADVDENWIEFGDGKLELSNLTYGDYTLSIRTIHASLSKSASSMLNFTVLPPFYKSKPALFLYVVLIFMSFLFFFLLHKRKIRKEKRLMLVKYEESQKKAIEDKALENEKTIIRLKNDSLRNEVKLKSKQLANTAMAVVKKNEVLLNLKKEILLNRDGFSNLNSFKKIVKQIDYSIEHEDEWEIFEYNFNQVHEEFFHQLTLLYSNLTNKDLKICAYIKMNLLNKEIAPLLNISVRGVETHRYRLKRKLILKNNENLTNFLHNFH